MNTGQIIKSRLTERFTTIPNDILRNKKLSAKAKGLICFLLSLPSDWVLYKTSLSDYFNDGYTALSSAFEELESLGYILSVKIIDENTKQFRGYNYIIYDEPHLSEKPITENLKSAFLKSGNLKLLNTNITKTEEQKKENINTEILNFKENLAFKEILKFYGFESELKFIQKHLDLNRFLNLITNEKKYDHFISQWKYYSLYHTGINFNYKFSWRRFLDGGWDEENWQKRYEISIKKNVPKEEVYTGKKQY